jgi:cyclase
MPGAKGRLPKSRFFSFERLTDGVYAAIADPGGGGFGNAAIVDLGDKTLVFDTGETPLVAEDLRAAAEGLTGRGTAYVVNSHAHPDHWFGNQVFGDDAAIIATQAAREHMLVFQQDALELKNDPSELEEMVRSDREKLPYVIDAGQNKVLRQGISRMENTLAGLPILEPKLPNLTFDGRMVLYGSERSAELHTRGAGHSSGDCFLVLPEEGIALLGDLAFFQRQPFMGDCTPDAWVAQLEDMQTWDIDVFVPGHGPVGTKADVALENDYIITLCALVTGSVKGDEPIERALDRPLPPPFDEWSIDGTPLEPNVRFLYEHLKES